jgi:hypothetical protein
LSRSQKWFIGISLLLVAPIIFGFMGRLLGISSIYQLSVFGMIAVFIGVHAIIFFLQNRMKLNYWALYIPAIGLLILTLFMGAIAIKNAGIECNIDDGCMNEDFSVLFAIILGFSTIISFLYSLLFQKLWYKKTA